MAFKYSSLIRRIQNLEEHHEEQGAPGRVLYFNEFSYPSPEAAERALQEMQEQEHYSQVIRINCQSREGMMYQDNVIPHPIQDLISYCDE